jgi:hypothetical protein
MDRTERPSPQHSYVLQVGVIISGVFSERAFRHEWRIVTWRIVVGTEEEHCYWDPIITLRNIVPEQWVREQDLGCFAGGRGSTKPIL